MFLATTSLNFFWNKNEKILFLGRWCLLYSQKAEWEDLNYIISNYPWDDRKRFAEAARYCSGLETIVLPALADFLNKHHGTKHSLRYWKIIIGPWLIRYIGALYDRYTCVRDAISSHGDLRTIGLSLTSLVTPYDYKEFEQLYAGSPYNLQLYTQVCEFLGVSFESKKELNVCPVAGSRPRSRMFQLLKWGYCKLSHGAFLLLANRMPIWIISLYASRTTQLKLMLSMLGRIWAPNVDSMDDKIFGIESRLKPNFVLRSQLPKGKDLPRQGEDPFVELLMTSLIHNFPLVYLEGYQKVVQKLRPLLKHLPKVLITATGFRGTKVYPFLAAEASERGTKLITIQHGGSYGTVQFHPMEAYDQSVSDEYWSWGWKDGLATPGKPMPSLVLCQMREGKPSKSKKRDSNKVLYCGNTMPQYLILMWSNPNGPQWGEVVEWQHRLYMQLSEKVLRCLTVRLDPGDRQNSWFQKEKIKIQFPNLNLDDHRFSLAKTFLDNDIIIVNSNHTVFLQALSMNKPTIIFWDPSWNELRPSAQLLFDQLAEVGILHYTPEGAANKVNGIIEDPYGWWKSDEVQKARTDFCRCFAYHSSNWKSAWKAELLPQIQN